MEKGGSSINISNGCSRRTFEQIRNLILVSLFSGRKTINQISNEINVNWKTVENHITYLAGKGYIKEIFSSEYVRIFEQTKKGHDYISQIIKKKEAKYISSEKEALFVKHF